MLVEYNRKYIYITDDEKSGGPSAVGGGGDRTAPVVHHAVHDRRCVPRSSYDYDDDER